MFMVEARVRRSQMAFHQDSCRSLRPVRIGGQTRPSMKVSTEKVAQEPATGAPFSIRWLMPTAQPSTSPSWQMEVKE